MAAEQVDWKLKRGKFRPRLLDFAKQHSDATVETASADAFQRAASGLVEDASAAMAPLTKLKVTIASLLPCAAAVPLHEQHVCAVPQRQLIPPI